MPAMKNPLMERKANTRQKSPRLVKIGRTVATPRVLETVPYSELLAALERHMCQDWGDLVAADWKANDKALKTGERLLSAYKSSSGTKFWIITEADRSCTTFLLPSEY